MAKHSLPPEIGEKNLLPKNPHNIENARTRTNKVGLKELINICSSNLCKISAKANPANNQTSFEGPKNNLFYKLLNTE